MITTHKHDDLYMAQARLGEPYVVTIVTNDRSKKAAIKRVQVILDALNIKENMPKPSKLKLTASQTEVIRRMRDGLDYYYNPITTFKPYTRGGYGYHAAAVHGAVMNNLETMGLVIKSHMLSNSVMYIYSLTKLGKTINL